MPWNIIPCELWLNYMGSQKLSSSQLICESYFMYLHKKEKSFSETNGHAGMSTGV